MENSLAGFVPANNVPRRHNPTSGKHFARLDVGQLVPFAGSRRSFFVGVADGISGRMTFRTPVAPHAFLFGGRVFYPCFNLFFVLLIKFKSYKIGVDVCWFDFVREGSRVFSIPLLSGHSLQALSLDDAFHPGSRPGPGPKRSGCTANAMYPGSATRPTTPADTKTTRAASTKTPQDS